MTAIVQDFEVLDVMVVAEQPGDLDFQLRYRHVDAAVARLAGVAHAGQHVGHGICHAHLAFRPVTSWLCARRESPPAARDRGNKCGTASTSAACRDCGPS